MTLRFLLVSLLSAITVYVLHTVALSKYLYWYFWWYDLLVHFLTGFSLALLAFVFIQKFFLEENVFGTKMFFWVLGVVLFFAGAWEVFEYKNQLTSVLNNYVEDTSTDILIALVGAILSLSFVREVITKDGRRE